MRTFIACAVAVTVVLAGCSNAPAGTPAAANLDATALELVTQTGSYHRQKHTLALAEERLVGRCMEAQGVSYPAPLPKFDHRTDEERAVKLEERRKHGYEWGKDEPALDRYVRKLPAEEREKFTRALFGSEANRRAIELPGGGPVSFPGEGCLYEAQSRLFGDIVTWARVTYLPEELNNKLAQGITDTGEYAEALTSWRECMKARGYDYERPAQAEQELKNRKVPRRDQISGAVADAECAQRARIPQLVIALKQNRAKTLTETERKSLRELSVKWSQAAAAAAELGR